MCKSMREHDKETSVRTAIEVATEILGPDNDKQIVKVVSTKCSVPPEYVANMMKPVAVPSVGAR